MNTGHFLPDCKKTSTFTGSYARYMRGAGSLLTTVSRESLPDSVVLRDGRLWDTNLLSLQDLKVLKLRYLSPQEVARIHGLPENFSFPVSSDIKKVHKLLGNGVCVTVVEHVARRLLSQMNG